MVSIRARLDNSPEGPRCLLYGPTASVCLADLLSSTSLSASPSELTGRSILIATRDQFAAACALIELDGIARRLILCTPDVPSAYLPAIVEQAAVDAIVSDNDRDGDGLAVALRIRTQPLMMAARAHPHVSTGVHQTEWILLTSGTTGAPKMVVHTFGTLTAAIRTIPQPGSDVVWGTFYDIRRYGGLQAFLRGILGGGSFVLSGAGEPVGAYLARLGAHGATHLSGTPSHWRRVLMSPEARAIAPRYIRLSGEIADQGILNAIRSFYPGADIAHAFASTEAGVGFEVADGLEGFPASLVGASGDVQMTVEADSLRIRSTRNAARYIGEDHTGLANQDGFIDTGDIVERRGDRYYFLGRRKGVINVGGLKVFPEEVEAAINRHPAVRVSIVRPKRSSITGSLVSADVVLDGATDSTGRHDDVKREILQICRDRLAPHKIPATIRFVPELEVAAAGKLARHA